MPPGCGATGRGSIIVTTDLRDSTDPDGSCPLSALATRLSRGFSLSGVTSPHPQRAHPSLDEPVGRGERRADDTGAVPQLPGRRTSPSGRIGVVNAGRDAGSPAAAELLGLAVGVAREAADLVSRGSASAGEQVEVKSSPVDVVTAVDRASEELIVSRLLAARPGDGILGEEGAARAGSSGVRWLVDPIDGTVNFLYGLPAYAVSIAAEVDGVVVAGAVLNAASGELFTAILGGGAFLSAPSAPEPVRLRGSRPASLGQTLVATGFGYEAELRREQGAVVARLLPEVRDIRRFGSAALDLCSAAAGRVDAYYERGVKRWDVAAGGLICSRSGLSVRELGPVGNGSPLPAGIAAAPGALIDELVALIS